MLMTLGLAWVLLILIFLLLFKALKPSEAKTNSKMNPTLLKRLQQLDGKNRSQTPLSIATRETSQKIVGVFKYLVPSKYFKLVREHVELLDLSLSDHELLALHFLCVNVGILLGILLFNNLFMGLLLATMLFSVPRIIFLRMIRNRIKAFNAQLPDACQIMSSTLKSGFSFRQCIQTIANDMADPIGREFSRVSQELNWGLNNREAFDNLYRRMQCDDLKLFTTSVIIQNEVGGKLSEVLIKISETIREREKIQGEIKSLTAQGKLSGIVIGALPLLLALVITLINPSYMQPLFAHPLGMILLGVAAFMQLTGMLVINKMVKVN